MAHPHWPIWDIVIRTPRLELHPVREADMAALTDLSLDGIHDPAVMPFTTPFTDVPSPEFERAAYQHYFRQWANWSPERWALQFAVLANGRLVGTQAIEATDFLVRRTVLSGSWLGAAHQRQGIGTEMRAAVLEFAFGHLGARRAETEAHADNSASLTVTRRLGYRPNGDRWTESRGRQVVTLDFVLDVDDWEHRTDVTVEGLGPEALSQFGLDATSDDDAQNARQNR